MKIICTADWHIHEFQEFSRSLTVAWSEETKRYITTQHGKEMNSRLFYILDGICDIRDYCVANNIRYVLNAGDVFHKRGTISVNALTAAYKVIQSFDDLNIKLIIISGNHDQVDSSDIPNSSIIPFEQHAQVIVSPTLVDLEGVQVVAVPYSFNKEFMINSIKFLLPKTTLNAPKLLLTHCGISGGKVGSGMILKNSDFSLSELSHDEFDFVVLGHFHCPQLLSKKAFYCGTPIQNNFSDEAIDSEFGDWNGFFELDTNSHQLDFHPIVAPRFVTLTPKEFSEKGNNIDYIRIKAFAEDLKSIPEISQSNVRVEIEKTYERPVRSSISILDSFDSAVKKYFDENYKDHYKDALKIGYEILNKARVGGK